MNIMKKNMPRISALIVAGGNGQRFGDSNVPKQYQFAFGKTVLDWSVDAFRQHPLISSVHVVINPAHQPYLKTTCLEQDNAIHFIQGGGTRQESVRRGLEHLKQSAPDTEYVLIHDAARPMVSKDLITSICQSLMEGENAVIPGIAITDTIKRSLPDMAGIKTESRDNLYTVQTPQAFKLDKILALHQKYKDEALTDDAALFEKESQPVKIIPGDQNNIKITYADDLPQLENSLAQARGDIRTGQGYDVHRLVPPIPGRALKLCGITIDHPFILEGHSDADVALHAITDALLACISNGDIGMHFSPKDTRWKNADSLQFLQHAASLIQQKDGIIAHIDVTIICEEPKIGPHRDAMRQILAKTLSLPVERISVKATTTEGLGFTGRKEGIAAQATATVRLPF